MWFNQSTHEKSLYSQACYYKYLTIDQLRTYAKNFTIMGQKADKP